LRARPVAGDLSGRLREPSIWRLIVRPTTTPCRPAVGRRVEIAAALDQMVVTCAPGAGDISFVSQAAWRRLCIGG
jgi:hypothetical protein